MSHFKELRDQARSSHAAKVKSHGGTCRAYGGATDAPKKRGAKTEINIVMAPSRSDPVRTSAPGAGAGPLMPSGPVPMPAPSPAGPPVQGGLGGLMKPMARGGRAKYDAGAATGEGRLEKVKNYGFKAKK